MQGAWLAVVAILAAALAGCAGGDRGGDEDGQPTVPNDVVVDVEVAGTMSFRRSVVTPAVGLNQDLFEPTIDVSDRGTIYVAGHVAGAVTTGTPAYVSRDDGATWAPLPFASTVATPPPGQGSAPPPGDEGYIVAGSDGRAWMLDVTLATYPVTGWCDDGAAQCSFNPDAYDRAASTTCVPQTVNDRPWGAFANGTLLMVNNGNTGHVEVGILRSGDLAGAHWATCLAPGGLVTGVPALRDDGVFAVPQRRAEGFAVVVGHVDDLAGAVVRPAFTFRHTFAGGDGNFGRAAFDADGTLFLAGLNNDGWGGLRVGVSRDDGASFAARTFKVPSSVGWMHLDAVPSSHGALLSWAQAAGTDRWDFYAAHVRAGDDGPVLEAASLVAPGVQGVHGDVLGSAVGPDGRAYVATYEGWGSLDYPLSNPVSVWVQDDGPTL